MAATKVTLKLLVDQTGKKVLFAEAGKDFVDFLFSILALPVGTVIRLLSAKKMVGCLGNLYKSIEDLNTAYMQPDQSKDTVLKPQAPIYGAQVPLLLPADASSASATRNVYKCPNYNNNSRHFGANHLNSSNCGLYVADDPNSHCPCCGNQMNIKGTYVAPPTPSPPTSSSSSTTTTAVDQGGFVRGVVTYMVMDDLVLKPMSTISTITLLNQFHVKDLGSLQEKVVELGMEEGLELLGASLKSKTVLTDVFFAKK